MASRKTTGNKMKSKGQKSSRASAMPPKAPEPLRAQGGATTMVPKPPLAGGAPNKPSGPENFKNPDQAHGKADKKLDKRAKVDTAPEDGDPLKKQELINLVVERSDVAKKHAKPVIEAMLAVLGDALAEGRELNLQPMGKVKRKRVKDTDNARVIVANIRQPKSAGASAGPLPGSTPGTGAGNLSGTVQGAPGAPAKPMRHPLKEAVADEGE